MTTLAQTSTGDLDLTAGKSLYKVTGAAEVAVKIRSRLKLFQGEWFLDTRVGTPYFQRIMGQKAPDLDLIKQLFTRELLTTPGVASVDSITVSLDGRTRVLSVGFTVRASSGGTVTATALDAPFIVVS